MPADEDIHGIIESLYDAVADERLWPAALKSLSEFTGSQAATFWVLDGSDKPRLPTFSFVDIDPAFVQAYLETAAPIDPTINYLVAHPDQPIVHDGLVISESQKDRNPYYDWQKRYSDLHFRLVGQVCPAPAVHAGVALHRTRNVGRYEPQDVEIFRALYRHLARALKIGFRLGSLSTMQQCTEELLNRNSAAIILLDDRKRVVYTNGRADALISKGDGIRVSAGGLTLTNKRDNQELQALIAEAISLTVIDGTSHRDTVRALRPSGRPPYVLLVSRVTRKYSALSMFRPAVCVLITDPDTRVLIPAERLQAAFGLTEAEARMAALLGAGEDLRSAAAKLRITYGTARVRLAEIFRKTDTRRQGELIKLLLSTLPSL
jgi:DNA-binding CsgD family transcriptional regulator